MSRTVAALQARIGSNRLPGKVLMGLRGQPMLAQARNTHAYRYPELFKFAGLVNSHDFSAARLTMATPEDIALVTKIYEYFGNDCFACT